MVPMVDGQEEDFIGERENKGLWEDSCLFVCFTWLELTCNIYLTLA